MWQISTWVCSVHCMLHLRDQGISNFKYDWLLRLAVLPYQDLIEQCWFSRNINYISENETLSPIANSESNVPVDQFQVWNYVGSWWWRDAVQCMLQSGHAIFYRELIWSTLSNHCTIMCTENVWQQLYVLFWNIASFSSILYCICHKSMWWECKFVNASITVSKKSLELLFINPFGYRSRGHTLI